MKNSTSAQDDFGSQRVVADVSPTDNNPSSFDHRGSIFQSNPASGIAVSNPQKSQTSMSQPTTDPNKSAWNTHSKIITKCQPSTNQIIALIYTHTFIYLKIFPTSDSWVLVDKWHVTAVQNLVMLMAKRSFETFKLSQPSIFVIIKIFSSHIKYYIITSSKCSNCIHH